MPIPLKFYTQPLEPLHPTIVSWPFDAWGLDVVGPLLLNPLLDMLTYWQQQIIFLNGQKLCHLKK